MQLLFEMKVKVFQNFVEAGGKVTSHAKINGPVTFDIEIPGEIHMNATEEQLLEIMRTEISYRNKLRKEK